MFHSPLRRPYYFSAASRSEPSKAPLAANFSFRSSNIAFRWVYFNPGENLPESLHERPTGNSTLVSNIAGIADHRASFREGSLRVFRDSHLPLKRPMAQRLEQVLRLALRLPLLGAQPQSLLSRDRQIPTCAPDMPWPVPSETGPTNDAREGDDQTLRVFRNP
jgi:hypothetical protein